jgi:6-phosphogluconolactonase
MQEKTATGLGLQRMLVGVALAGLIGTIGCGNFFTKDTGTGTGTGGGSGSGPSSGVNRAYVLASTAKTISGFTIGTGTLTAVPGNAQFDPSAPQAAVITPNGRFLYAAGPGTINVYMVASDGSLSLGSAVYIATVVSLAISPDGQWMFGLDTLNQVLDEWQISSDGTLNTLTPVSYTTGGGIFAPRALTISPSGGLIFAVLGTAGEAGFTLNTTTGLAVQTQTLKPIDSQTSDSAVAVNAGSTLLYLARSGTSGGLSVYTIGANGAISPTAGSPYAVGAGASSVALEGTGKYVYVANRSDSTISGFLIGTAGALTAVTGSPFAAGSQISSLGIDITGAYLVGAALGGGPDLALYSFDTTVPGKLNSTATASVGTSSPGASLVILTR